MKVIGHFLIVDQIPDEYVSETKKAIVDIESIVKIECSLNTKNKKEYSTIFFHECDPIVVENSIEEITNTLENEYFEEEY